MPISITPAEKAEITKIVCPHCNERVNGVGLLRDSRIEGLTFRCKRCGEFWHVKTE